MSPLARLLVVGSFGLVVASIVLVSTSRGSSTDLAFLVALVAFVVAATADAMDRRRCDRFGFSDRLRSAIFLWRGALVMGVVSAYFSASAAAL